MDQAFTATATLLAEPSRAAMLLKLLGGKALPAGELAAAANVSPQTASGHLTKLTRARLIVAHSQGRHRYYRLASVEVANALEAILVLLPGAQEQRDSRTQAKIGTIAHARTCYSHLAGWLGVCITDALLTKGYLLSAANRAFLVTDAGRAWLTMVGITVPNKAPDPPAKYARACLDWTERRPHVAGLLGVDLYRRFLDLRWLATNPKTRAVRITLEGRRKLQEHLGVSAGQ